MYVKSIELINFKSYKNCKLNFSSGINLLIGANNSGKSTIIKSLQNFQFQGIIQKKDIRATTEYLKIFAEIVDINKEENRNFWEKVTHINNFNSDKLTLVYNYPNNDQPEQFFYYDSKFSTKRLQYDRIEVKDSMGNTIELEKFPRFSDNENQNNFIYPFLAKRKIDNYDTNSGQEQTFRVTENFRNISAKIQKIGNPSHPMNSKFNELCDDILGFNVGVIPTESNNGMEPGIYVNNNNIIPLRSMGEGVANILGFIIILLTEDRKLFFN